MPVIDPSASDDAPSLDLLLRGRRSWTDRVRVAVGQRPAIVGAAVLVVVVGVLVAIAASRGRPAPVELPRTGAAPAGDTAAPAGSTDSPGPPGSALPTGSASTSTGPTQLVVHVAGAVVAPGLVELPAGARVADAVRGAGGLRPDADGDRLNLAQPVADGQRVYVPAVGQASTPAAVGVEGGAAEASGERGNGGATAPASPVDLNAATAAELDALPGVGPATAAAIVAHRDEHGPFRSVDELDDVRGIGPAKFDALSPLVTVGP